ncbi:MAG: Ig-like domain-containing protein, partial [Sinobacterium sp.]
MSTLTGTLNDTSPTTASSGQVTVEYVASASGEDVITASALNVESRFDIVIQQDDFSFTTVPTKEIALKDSGILILTWLRDEVEFVGGNISFTSSRGTITLADSVTDTNGQASFSIKSDNAGFASISATGTATGTDGEVVTVNARAEVEFVATVAHSIIVDGTPDTVGPDGQTSTITAVVRDAAGNLVKGKVINFVVDDVSGGNISVNQATTDRSGIASTVYQSNAVSTFEAVKAYATVDDDQSISDFTSLTVGDRAFDISIGTGRLIEIPTDSSYSKEFSVFVTDPDSNPVENVNLTFSATPEKFALGGVYRKGFWVYNEDIDVWQTFVTAVCANEDVDGNGILDAAEDTNGDGQLTPG